MKLRHKQYTQRCWVLELAQAGVESTEAAYQFLGPDDWLRDQFPLPGAGERSQWLGFWSDDRRVWESVLDRVLGRQPADMPSDDSTMLMKSFDSINQFFDRDDQRLDSFFRSLEVRFILRVFLPCLAKTFHRPSTVLALILQAEDMALLEEVVRFDPTVLYHDDVATLLNPANSAIRRARWELLQSAIRQPANNVERRKVKYGIAALLRQIASRVGYKLTQRTLLSMYNAVAVAGGMGLRDPDLLEDPETFARGVRRFGSELPRIC